MSEYKVVVVVMFRYVYMCEYVYLILNVTKRQLFIIVSSSQPRYLQ